MLGWFAEAPDPDAGLLGFRRVSDALGNTHWYLGLLRDAGEVAQRLARILASSRYATDLLMQAPEAVKMLADDADLAPRGRAALDAEVAAAVGRNEPGPAVAAVRGIRRRELFRTSAAELLGLADVEAVGCALSDTAAATVVGGLAIAQRVVEAQTAMPLPTRLAVIAMGRFGGDELGYGSDADVLFVHQPLPDADEKAASDAAQAVANELRGLLAAPGPDPQLLIDADLRPEGRQGPLVRTLGSYAAYYARWSDVWESQALLRAKPVAGDAALGARFTQLIDPMRYPADGVSEAQVREIRRIKARVEAERLPRAPTPRCTSSSAAVALPTSSGRCSSAAAARLDGAHPADDQDPRRARGGGRRGPRRRDRRRDAAEAWRLASRLRNAVTLVRGRATDTLPAQTRELAGVALTVGYAPGHTGDLVEDYRRATRRARGVVERVFYG